jgi:hypothetical protein
MTQKKSKKAEQMRVNKTLAQKVLDLDAHLYLLRSHLEGLSQSASHLKGVAAELRTLICRSSGTEGLLIRMINELAVDDRINLHIPGDLIEDHPLVQHLQFAIVPVKRSGQGPAEITPYDHSFTRMIRDSQALIAVGKPLTHEYLIKAIAQQMGSAHEDEGLEPALVQLSGIFLNGVEPFVEVLATDAELALEIGERVLEAAEKKGIIQRPFHTENYGNVSIAFRIQRKADLAAPVEVCRFLAYGPAAAIICTVDNFGAEFTLSKSGIAVAKLAIPHPSEFEAGDDIVFVLSYCSRTGQARAMTAFNNTDLVPCQLGWIHAGDLEITMEDDFKGLLVMCFLLTFQRLLPTKDVVELQALPPDGYGLWLPSEELDVRGPFPA